MPRSAADGRMLQYDAFMMFPAVQIVEQLPPRDQEATNHCADD